MDVIHTATDLDASWSLGIGQDTDDEWIVVMLSPCCNKQLEWRTNKNVCTDCETATPQRGFTDPTHLLKHNEYLEGWLCTWLSKDDVKVKIEWSYS